MPNDMSKEQAAAQKNHADQIKAERAVMRVLGVSRSQAREAINGFQNSSIQQANNRTVAPLAITPKEEQTIARVGSKLDLQPFKQPGVAEVSGAKGSGLGPIGDFIVMRVNPDTEVVEMWSGCEVSLTLGTLET